MTRTTAATAFVVAFVLPFAAMAQVDPVTMLEASQGTETNQPRTWIHVRGAGELWFFALDVLATVALTALIVYHPVRRNSRRTVADLVMPRLFFLYALIGMSVGFLVDHHGAIIGFVVFGIGALLRFRSNLDDPVDTVEMIAVTVLGLAVGLGLPVMALSVAMVTWCFIWLGGRNPGVEIALRGGDEPAALQAASLVEAMAAQAGWTLVRKHHVPGKLRVTMLYVTAGALSDAQIETMISQAVPEGTDLKMTL